MQVFLYEDDENLQRSLHFSLSRVGYTVTSCRSPDELTAHTLLAQANIQLTTSKMIFAITLQWSPLKSFVQWAKTALDQGVGILILAGKECRSLGKTHRANKPLEILHKPFDREELLCKVSRLQVKMVGLKSGNSK